MIIVKGIKTYTGSVILGSGHSLIIGHGPQLTKLEKLTLTEADARRRIEQFGLFNVSSPSNNNYYPDVTENDLTPKAEDYIRPIFRGLSEVIVRKQSDPIDFSDTGVLKASIDKIVGQTVYTNHETFVGNEVGAVSKSFWDETYDFNGVSVPAGMNLEFLIDGKSHPKIARGIMSEVPTIHSNSVNVEFTWQQSHPTMKFEDFRSKVGTFGSDGTLIRRIANNILSYGESSLVGHGADPYAQKVVAGKIVNPKYAASKDNFSENKPGKSYFFMDYKDKTILSDITIPDETNINELEDNSQNENEIPMKKGLILLLAQMAGVTLTAEQSGISEAEFAEKFDFKAFNTQLEAGETKLKEVLDNAGKLTDLTGQVATLTTNNTELTKFKTDNEPKLANLAVLEAHTAKQKTELIRIATLALGKVPDAALLATFNSGDLTTTNAFLTTYEAQLETKFPIECHDCHSKNVGRNSTEADGNENKNDPTKPKSATQLQKEFLADRRKKMMHETVANFGEAQVKEETAK